MPLLPAANATKNLTGTKAMLAKVFADTAVFNPPLLVVYYAATGVLEGKTAEKIKEKVENSWLDAYLAACMFWPFVQILNFRLIPAAMQANVVNTVGIGWQSYLSYSNHVREYEYNKTVPHIEIIDVLDGVKDDKLTLPSDGGFGFQPANPDEADAGEGGSEKLM